MAEQQTRPSRQRGREYNLHRRAQLELAIRKGLANPRERPDQYFLLVLWTPEESAAGPEPLEALLDGLEPPLRPWVEEALGARAFIETWKARFREPPSAEAFWLFLAKPAICRLKTGCLAELCGQDGLAFARALFEMAPPIKEQAGVGEGTRTKKPPLNSWLALRRKKRPDAGLDPCQRAVLRALRAVWTDELARKLKRELSTRLDQDLGARVEELCEPFPLFLGLPPWGEEATSYLDEIADELERCPQEEVRQTILLPGLPQLFDELTAPRLEKRRGCRSSRPGTRLFALGPRNRWPALFRALLPKYDAWSKEHPSHHEQKRFFSAFGTVGEFSLETFDVYCRALEALGEAEE
jgi:hypothetical protein